MPTLPSRGLDATARDELDREGERHAAAERAIAPGDRLAHIAEMNCHLSRIDEILRDYARRSLSH